MGEKLISLWEQHSKAILSLTGNIFIAVIIIIVGIALSKAAQKLIKKANTTYTQTGGVVASLFRGIIRYGIFIICIIMVLNVFGVNTSSLLALLGAAGVAIGLALKDTLGNIAAGITLLVLGTFRTGEFIEFGSFSGTVKEINLFTTILETPDGICISTPNSSIWGSPLKNYTRNGKRRMEISINIALTDSVDAAFQVLQSAIDEERRFLKTPAPQIILQAVQDSSVKITIRAWASIDDYWNIYWELNKILKEKIETSGLCIPVPRQDIHIVHVNSGT